MQKAIEENAHAALDQGEYTRRYNGLRVCGADDLLVKFRDGTEIRVAA
jgi:hypothetical protein